MKLLYVINSLTGAGGMQRVLLLKAAYLADVMDYNVTIITTNDSEIGEIFYSVSPLVKIIDIRPVQTSKVTYFKSYSTLLNKAIDAENPDIIIMCDNGLKSFLLPFIVKGGRKMVYERHTPKVFQNKRIVRNYVRSLYDALIYRFMVYSAAKFDKFLVVTQQGKNEWGIKNIAAIPNPLWFSTNVVSNLSNKRVIAVGRHAYEKGYDRMFAVWKQVVDKHPEWVLDIYGDDNPEYNIRQLAHDAGVDKNVNFITSTKHIIDAYLESSICIMTSRYEGFGMVLLEAMACGVPCVAFNCPVGPSDIISNSIDGLLVQDGNIEEFVKSVLLLIENAALRLEMGANAKISSEDYDINVIMKEWDTLFRSLFQRAEIA